MAADLTIHLLSSFDDPALGGEQWNALLCVGDTQTVFQTWEWQKAWWGAFGRGQLLLLAAERGGRIVALAPLFYDSGMIFFVGSGGSDYLDFIGHIDDLDLLAALLEKARARVPDFLGFRFYHVPEQSRLAWQLRVVAQRLGLQYCDEGSLPAPQLALSAEPETARAATRKKSLRRHERFFRREGDLRVLHLHEGEAILPHLPAFFAQHIARWEVTPYPSLFHDAKQRHFYRTLTQLAASSGWLRFTRIEWQGHPIAFHFGFLYQGRFLWYKPSFDVALARRSPGEVLLRQLLLAALAEEADMFDFGLGDEPFKARFATHTAGVRTWGLYPPEVCAETGEAGG